MLAVIVAPMTEENPRKPERLARRWIGTIALAGLLVATFGVVADRLEARDGPRPEAASPTGVLTADPVQEAGIEMCAASSDGTVASGWSDVRPMFGQSTDPNYLVFNSTLDHEDLGDERNWVRVRLAEDTAPERWVDRIEAKRDQLYRVSAYVHLDGPADQVASDTALSFHLPTCTAHLIAVAGFLESIDTSPMTYSDGAEFWAREDFNLLYVHDSAILENNVDTFPLSDDILTKGGVPIGVEQMDGNFKPGEGNSAFISFVVKAQFAPQ